MKAFMGLIILGMVGFIGYNIISDKEIQLKVFSAIENSTGFAFARPNYTVNTLDSFFKDLGKVNTKFQKSMDAWGNEIINKLNTRQLRQLKRELKQEIENGGDNLDIILDKYLSKAEKNIF